MADYSTDPRVRAIAEGIALGMQRAGHINPLPALIEQQMTFADDVLAEVDAASPDATIRRLQQSLSEAYGGDPAEWNLDRGMQIMAELRDLADLQRELKRAFAADELDGGWRAAHKHPLYVQADARVANLRDELKGLI